MALATTPDPTVDTSDYGNDISTFVDGIPDLSDDVLIEGPIVVGENVARVLTMRRGSLFYDATKGRNLFDLVNHDPGPGELAREEELASKEARGVDGVVEATVAITLLDRILRIKCALLTIGGTRLQVVIDDAVSILIVP